MSLGFRLLTCKIRIIVKIIKESEMMIMVMRKKKEEKKERGRKRKET